ncbi:unnamed protein product, partial [Leptidea sinapis]
QVEQLFGTLPVINAVEDTQ